jgi:hypothetical protein
MSTFNEANQVRLALKMKLSQHYWYSRSVVLASEDGYEILITVKFMDNNVRKVVPPVIDSVSIRTQVE